MSGVRRSFELEEAAPQTEAALRTLPSRFFGRAAAPTAALGRGRSALAGGALAGLLLLLGAACLLALGASPTAPSAARPAVASLLPREQAQLVASSFPSEPPSPCSELAQRALEGHLIGAFVPRCQEDGSFASTQCHGSTGYCWCSDEAGNLLPGTLKGPAEDGRFSEEECAAARSLRHPPGTCFAAADRAQQRRGGRSASGGVFKPKCTSSGSFAAQQCRNSSTTCWCVDKEGNELPGLSSRGAPGEVTNEDCVLSRRLAQPVTACEAAVARASSEESEPSCEADGSFSALQCCAARGTIECYCAAASGRELSGTRGRPGLTTELCSLEREQLQHARTQCERERADALAATRKGMVGVRAPFCDDQGAYAARQCHGSTGHCWCADANGNELPGTRGRPGPLESTECVSLRGQCPALYPDACRASPASYGTCQLTVARHFFNATSGRCEKYTMAGCMGSENDFPTEEACIVHCGGASTLKQEYPGRGATGSEGVASTSSCREGLRTARSLEDRGLLGVFHPQCTEDMEWRAMQCHKTYGCWCVDRSGTPYSGTQQTFFGAEPRTAADLEGECESLRAFCEPCSDPAEEKCTPRHQAQGVNCVVGLCVGRSSVDGADSVGETSASEPAARAAVE